MYRSFSGSLYHPTKISGNQNETSARFSKDKGTARIFLVRSTTGSVIMKLILEIYNLRPRRQNQSFSNCSRDSTAHKNRNTAHYVQQDAVAELSDSRILKNSNAHWNSQEKTGHEYRGHAIVVPGIQTSTICALTVLEKTDSNVLHFYGSILEVGLISESLKTFKPFEYTQKTRW